MVKAVCNVYSRFENYVTRALVHEIQSNRHPFWNDWIKPVETDSQRAEILKGGPCIIVASSGMLNGGASVYYATKMVANEHDAILLTGYQDEESPGRRLLDLASEQIENRKISLCGEDITVKSSVHLFGLSAHADRMEMAGFIDSIRPQTVLLVHGSNDARDSLKKSLRCKDCISGFDGLSFERSFKIGHTIENNDSVEMPQEKDLERIRAILGPPSSLPVLEKKDQRLVSKWYRSKNKVTVQQGCAAEVLQMCNIENESVNMQTCSISCSNEIQPMISEEKGDVIIKEKEVNSNITYDKSTDSRLTLNILKQRGYLLDYGYSAAEKTGPPHASVFSVKAWVKLPDESIIESQLEKGRSNKDAEKNAAAAIVKMIGNL